MQKRYIYKIGESKVAKTWGNGYATCRLEITDTHTGETKICDDFTYLDWDEAEDEQGTLAHIFNSNFEN